MVCVDTSSPVTHDTSHQCFKSLHTVTHHAVFNIVCFTNNYLPCSI